MATSEDDLHDVFEEDAITPKRGKITPIDIISLERREIDEKTVTDLVQALARDGRFLHPIVVREEGATAYRLIAGHHRLEAWKRHFGKQAPIGADIFPSDTPDARIEVLEIEENLLRKELTAAERDAQTLRLAAALKKLDGEKLATELPVSGSNAKSATSGGRGKKAATAKLASKLGVTKAAVQKRIKAASAAIGEEIDLDHDTPEELERKAAELEKAEKRQRAEATAERPKRRKPAPRVENPTPAESHAGEIDSEIEEVWRAFSALSERKQLKIMLRACRLRGWGLRMGPRWRIPAVDEAGALPPKPAPATYDTAVDSQPEQQEDGADVSADLQHPGDAVSQAADQEPELAVDLPAEVTPATDPNAVGSLAEQGDDAAAEQVGQGQDTAIEEAEQGNGSAELAEDLQDAGDDICEAADQEPGGKVTCAYCNLEFLSGDQSYEINGRLYHDGFCLNYGKKIAVAPE